MINRCLHFTKWHISGCTHLSFSTSGNRDSSSENCLYNSHLMSMMTSSFEHVIALDKQESGTSRSYLVMTLEQINRQKQTCTCDDADFGGTPILCHRTLSSSHYSRILLAVTPQRGRKAGGELRAPHFSQRWVRSTDIQLLLWHLT